MIRVVVMRFSWGKRALIAVHPVMFGQLDTSLFYDVVSQDLLPNPNLPTPPRLINIPHLPPRDFQPHLHRPTPPVLIHIPDLLPLPDPKSAPLALSINPPLRLKLNARIPPSDRSTYSPALHVDSGRCLAVQSGLTARGGDDIFPQIASGGRGGEVRRQGSFAGGGMVVEIPFKKLEVVPNFAGLVVAAVGFAFEDCDVGLV